LVGEEQETKTESNQDFQRYAILLITNDAQDGGESKTYLFPDGSVSTILLSQAQNQPFLCLIGLRSAPMLCPPHLCGRQ
jgi:hypothetical protein